MIRISERWITRAVWKCERISIELPICYDGQVPSHQVKWETLIFQESFLSAVSARSYKVWTEHHANSGQGIWTERKVYDIYHAHVRWRESFTIAWKLVKNTVRIVIFVTSAKLCRLGYRTSTCMCMHTFHGMQAYIHPSDWSNAIPSLPRAKLCKSHYRRGKGGTHKYLPKILK